MPHRKLCFKTLFYRILKVQLKYKHRSITKLSLSCGVGLAEGSCCEGGQCNDFKLYHNFFGRGILYFEISSRIRPGLNY